MPEVQACVSLPGFYVCGAGDQIQVLMLGQYVLLATEILSFVPR